MRSAWPRRDSRADSRSLAGAGRRRGKHGRADYPYNDETPGAREAGAACWSNARCATFDKERQSVYTQGLVTLQAEADAVLIPGANKCGALTPAQQIQVLKAIETTPFFAQVRPHCNRFSIQSGVRRGIRTRSGGI